MTKQKRNSSFLKRSFLVQNFHGSVKKTQPPRYLTSQIQWGNISSEVQLYRCLPREINKEVSEAKPILLTFWSLDGFAPLLKPRWKKTEKQNTSCFSPLPKYCCF